MQSSSEQLLVGEKHCVTTLITTAKETIRYRSWVDITEKKAHPMRCNSNNSFASYGFLGVRKHERI